MTKTFNLREAERLMDQFSTMATDADAELTEAADRITKLMEMLRLATKTYNDLRSVNEDGLANFNSLSDELQKMHGYMSSMAQQMNDPEENNQPTPTSEQDLKKTMETNLITNVTNYRTIHNDSEQLKRRLDAFRNEDDPFRKKSKETQEALTKLEKDLRNLVGETTKGNVLELLKIIRDKIREQQAEMTGRQTQSKGCRGYIDRLTGERMHLAKVLHQLLEKCVDIDRDLTKLNLSDNKTYQGPGPGAESKLPRASEFDQPLEWLLNRISALANDLRQSQIEGQKAHDSDQKAQVDQRQSRARLRESQGRSEAMRKRAEELAKQIRDAKSACDQLLDVAERRKTQLQERVFDAEGAIKDDNLIYNEMTKDLKKQNDAFGDELNRGKQDLDNCKRQVSTLRDQRQRLEKQKTELNERLKEREAEFEKLQLANDQELKEIDDKLDRLDEEKRQLEQKKTEVRQTTTVHKKTLVTLSDQTENLRATDESCNQIEAEIDRLRLQRQRLDEKLAGLQQELRDEHQLFRDLTGKLAKIQKDIDELKEDTERARQGRSRRRCSGRREDSVEESNEGQTDEVKVSDKKDEKSEKRQQVSGQWSHEERRRTITKKTVSKIETTSPEVTSSTPDVGASKTRSNAPSRLPESQTPVKGQPRSTSDQQTLQRKSQRSSQRETKSGVRPSSIPRLTGRTPDRKSEPEPEEKQEFSTDPMVTFVDQKLLSPSNGSSTGSGSILSPAEMRRDFHTQPMLPTRALSAQVKRSSSSSEKPTTPGRPKSPPPPAMPGKQRKWSSPATPPIFAQQSERPKKPLCAQQPVEEGSDSDDSSKPSPLEPSSGRSPMVVDVAPKPASSIDPVKQPVTTPIAASVKKPSSLRKPADVKRGLRNKRTPTPDSARPKSSSSAAKGVAEVTGAEDDDDDDDERLVDDSDRSDSAERLVKSKRGRPATTPENRPYFASGSADVKGQEVKTPGVKGSEVKGSAAVNRSGGVSAQFEQRVQPGRGGGSGTTAELGSSSKPSSPTKFGFATPKRGQPKAEPTIGVRSESPRQPDSSTKTASSVLKRRSPTLVKTASPPRGRISQPDSSIMFGRSRPTPSNVTSGGQEETEEQQITSVSSTVGVVGGAAVSESQVAESSAADVVVDVDAEILYQPPSQLSSQTSI